LAWKDATIIMTDIAENDSTTGDTAPAWAKGWSLPPPATPGRAATEDLAAQLVDEARAEGVNLVGPGGLLGDLTKRVLEAGLEAELDDHLGYSKHDPVGRDGGNSRNGTRTKTVLTDVGPVRSTCRGIGTGRSSRSWSASGNAVSAGSTRW
jgi:hypothetical protein